MPSNTASQAIKAARRQKVWDLRLENKTQEQIAYELGVNQATVSRDIRLLIKNAKRNLDDQVKQEQVIQLHQLRLVIQNAWVAWEASKARGTSITKREATETDSQGLTTTKVWTTSHVVERDGNPKYLEIVLQGLADIRKFFGLDVMMDDNWEKELKELGIDASSMFEMIAQDAYVKLKGER